MRSSPSGRIVPSHSGHVGEVVCVCGSSIELESVVVSDLFSVNIVNIVFVSDFIVRSNINTCLNKTSCCS